MNVFVHLTLITLACVSAYKWRKGKIKAEMQEVTTDVTETENTTV